MLHLPLQDDQLLAQERVFGDEFRFDPEQISGSAFEQRTGRRFGPALKAFFSFFHDSAQDGPQGA